MGIENFLLDSTKKISNLPKEISLVGWVFRI